MLGKLFLGLSMVGAEWVLYLLLVLSVLSIALIIERARFYHLASQGIFDFRKKIREATLAGKLEDATRLAQVRSDRQTSQTLDLETEMALSLLQEGQASPERLSQIATDSVVRARLVWDKNLSLLATIGSNAPFIGLFGTVLGIIRAFHDLSQQTGSSAQMVTSGISEALVATAVGLLVAIPAVVAFNLFQRRVKCALSEAEALKCYLIGKLAK